MKIMMIGCVGLVTLLIGFPAAIYLSMLLDKHGSPLFADMMAFTVAQLFDSRIKQAGVGRSEEQFEERLRRLGLKVRSSWPSPGNPERRIEVPIPALLSPSVIGCGKGRAFISWDRDGDKRIRDVRTEIGYVCV